MSKDAKIKIPKRIGGVKVPKELRKAGNSLIERAQGPEGREMLVGALAVAATTATAAFAKAAVQRSAAAHASPEAQSPGNDTSLHGQRSGADPQVLNEALNTVAEQVLGRLFGARKA